MKINGLTMFINLTMEHVTYNFSEPVVVDPTQDLPLCAAFKRHWYVRINNFTSTNGSLTRLSSRNSSLVHLSILKYIIPFICFFGIVGNILNLVVLTRKRMLTGMDRLARSASYGLVALAVSDMCFCMCVFPYAFLSDHRDTYATDGRVIILYLKVYTQACVNLFLMTSTLLIVTMAINRYVVVVYPLHAREILSAHKTLISIVVVCVISIAFTMPYFLHGKVRHCRTPDGQLASEKTLRWKKESDTTISLQFYMHWIWPILATFAPIFILLICNIRLIKELHKASSQRRNSLRTNVSRERNNFSITLTLVVIVLMLFFLVFPGEVLKFTNPYRWGVVGHYIALTANIMQAINFSVNFILYCALNTQFRNTLSFLFVHMCKKTESMTSFGDYSLQRQTTFHTTCRSYVTCAEDGV